MKKFASLLLAAIMILSLAACGTHEEEPTDPSTSPAIGEQSPSPDIADETSTEPSTEPSAETTAEPSEEPSDEPSEEPSTTPIADPTAKPTAKPTATPTPAPSAKPSDTPSIATPDPSAVPSSTPEPAVEKKMCDYHGVEDECWAHDGYLCSVHDEYDDCWEHSGFYYCDEHQSYDDCHNGGVHLNAQAKCYAHNNYDDCYLHDGYYCAEHKTYDNCIEPVIPETASKAAKFWQDTASKYEDTTPALMELGESDIADLYGLDMSNVDDFYVAMPMLSMHINEVFIAHVTGDMDAVKTACENRQQALLGGFLYPSHVDLVENYKLVTAGDWICFVIHENAADIANDFTAAFAE